MCGIAGFEIEGVDVPATSAGLIHALSPRGPDASWAAVRGSVALVETRLAVIDLSDDVVYPMANESDDVHLVFNGEIYEHDVLRRDLEARGHRFRTRCDAEVVLHGFEEWGVEVFPRLNGMFALSIVDERTGDVVLARDRLGIKPLVRTTGRRFAFASDAIALVAAGLSEGQIDAEALSGFAGFHYVPPPRTGLADVVQVAPGTAIRRTPDGDEEEVAWSESPFSEPGAGDVTVGEADETLIASVRRQLLADVPVGVFLSGGLDSTLVLSAAVALGARPAAFTIGFGGHGDYDESQAATATARRLGVEHHVTQLDISFSAAVEAVASAYDAPYADSSAIATIELARLARDHVTVALSGTGGDDLFAGYYRHRAHRLRRYVQRVPRPLLRLAAQGQGAQGRSRQSRLGLGRSYFARLAGAGAGSDVEQYLTLIGSATSPLGLSPLRFPVRPETARDVAERFGFRDPLEPSTLRGIQRFELSTYLPGDLLCKEDRATMAVGLEGRVPLLDEAFLRLAERTPEHRTMSLRKGKMLLYELAHRYGVQVSSLKRGFAVPLGAYFSGPWRQEAREWFGSNQSQLVDTAAASRLLELETPPASDLWMLASLIGWEQRQESARRAAPSEAATVPVDSRV